MNLINYILNFKNNIFTNKKFALVVSLVTISLLFSYNFFLKKLYSSKIEIKVESLSEISFSPNYRLRGSFISYSEINSKATIFFEDKFVDPKDAHKKDKIFFNLINNIKKKINITYKRNFDKIFSDDIWYTIEIKEKNLDKLDINREKLFTEIKTYNMAIEKQFLDHLDKSVIPYIDYMLEKNQELIMSLNSDYEANNVYKAELGISNYKLKEQKRNIIIFKDYIKNEDTNFITYKEIKINKTETQTEDYLNQILISFLIWAIIILIGNITILEYHRHKKENK